MQHKVYIALLLDPILSSVLWPNPRHWHCLAWHCLLCAVLWPGPPRLALLSVAAIPGMSLPSRLCCAVAQSSWLALLCMAAIPGMALLSYLAQ